MRLEQQAGDGKKRKFERKYIAAERLEIWEALEVTVELPTADGEGDFEFIFAEPALLLQRVVNSSPALQTAFVDAVAKSGRPTRERPWQMVVGFDEFIPGNQFRPESGRKSMVLSFTVKQLGKRFLGCEDAWLTPVVLRAREMKKVQGGWAACLTVFLRRALHGPLGLSVVGATLLLHGQPLLLFLDLGILLSDNDGIRMALDCKGAAGLRPCPCCVNVWKKGSLPHGENMVEITCFDTAKFIPATTEYLDEVVGLMQDAHVAVEWLGARARVRCAQSARFGFFFARAAFLGRLCAGSTPTHRQWLLRVTCRMGGSRSFKKRWVGISTSAAFCSTRHFAQHCCGR
jgi:hypothetical protein